MNSERKQLELNYEYALHAHKLRIINESKYQSLTETRTDLENARHELKISRIERKYSHE